MLRLHKRSISGSFHPLLSNLNLTPSTTTIVAQIYSDQLDNKSFRLATVSLGAFPDIETQVPSVTLATHPLSPRIAYNALSYTWGPPRNLEEIDDSNAIILLNGHLFEVQPNLYDALLELEATCPETPIWIDALCINQSNQTERSAQVSVMNQIYGGAARVIVWLGKATPELAAGVKAAERIGTVCSSHHSHAQNSNLGFRQHSIKHARKVWYATHQRRRCCRISYTFLM